MLTATLHTGRLDLAVPTAGDAEATPALAIPLLVAVYHQRHADVPGVFGPVAYATNLIGLGLFGGAAFTIDTALFYLAAPVRDHLKHEPTIAALLGSAVVFAVGSVLFGAFLLRSRGVPAAAVLGVHRLSRAAGRPVTVA